MTAETILRAILALPGLTAAHLLHWADNAALVAQQLHLQGYPEAAREAEDFARALRDAAPRYPDPPLVPANAVEAG